MILSIILLTWNRGADLLRNSLYTLSDQTEPPDEIVVVEASPTEGYHQATRALCAQYGLVRLVETSWPKFNVSRGMNAGIRAAREDAEYIAPTCMEMFFSRDFIAAVRQRLKPGHITFTCCGSLHEDTDASQGPEHVRANWDWYCGRVRPNPPIISPGAFLGAERSWWFSIRGYDEARRPYSYPDLDLCDRAGRSGLVESHVYWDEAQVLHPWHPLSPLFYSVSGSPVDPRIDREVVRNSENWGSL